ncbi:DUF6809 family protein [Beduinella massiliensis]|uniref:DUF6809 family protein n=1 Tax=Beduinella massiliensis TaxID=1852363 RepID=UPI000C8441A3
MGKILEALANDQLVFATKYFEDGTNCDQAVKRWIEADRSLRAMLNAEGSKHLDDLNGARNQLSSLSSTDSFCIGFRLGALMLVEVFTERDGLIGKAESE